MHYYKKNIGDYSKKAGRLSILQHGVYNLLLDACYDREKFPSREEAIDWVWASTTEEVEAVDFVLRKFFVLENGKYVQGRIQEAITEYQDFCSQQKEKGAKGGRPKKADGEENKPGGFSVEADGLPDGSQRDGNKTLTTNQEPLTTNQEPIKPSSNKFSDEDMAIAEKIYFHVKQVASKTRKPDFDKWADDVRLMRDRDGHTPDEIWAVFLFANSDSFWKTNILSPGKLREKFSQLHARMQNGDSNAQRNGPYQTQSDRLAESARFAGIGPEDSPNVIDGSFEHVS